ncbi:MAG: ATP-dependent helicase, partial [Acetatifactor sp.]|nr:ATP-dependent helicase [Acetatifactor sp.]
VGSGKTTVLIAKLLYLSYIKNIRYSQMIVLTFTHKAAEEIRRRLETWEGSLTPEQLTGFGTFHSVAYRLLKQSLPIEELGYTREFQVLLPERELELAQEIIQDRGYKIKYPARLKKRLEAAQRLGRQGRDSVEGKRLDKLQDDIWQLAETLEQEKRQRNVMTFRELLVCGEKLLRRYPICPAWIVIDEVQDSDEQQLAFLDALRGPDTRLFAVGDPNQIIYGWRGSSINACFTLVHRYGARELTLPMNYRSGSRILEAARYFKQYGDKLTGSRDCSGQVRIRQAYDPLGEAYYLAEQIRKLQSGGVPLGQIAIFYRLQAQAQPLADVFAREGIPCRIVTRREQDSGESYLEQEGIRIYGEDGDGSSSEPSQQAMTPCREREEPESVWLMTLHASKGLEFSHVFIIGVNYGLIPLHPSGFEEEEEERRLFFVGMTRAKDYLELSYYIQPALPKVVPGESRYLQMIPERLVERVDGSNMTGLVNELGKTGSDSEESETGSENKELAGGESGDAAPGSATPRQVRHIKYGVGVVTGETEEKITVDFGELGSKSFMKDFVSLEPVTEA